jgi:hypothetical protein
MRQAGDLENARIAVFADSDSRWKWALATAKQLNASRPDCYLRRTAAAPSPRQLREAGADPSRVTELPIGDLPGVLAEHPCDVLILGLPGDAVQAVLQAFAAQSPVQRPILISGYVGIIYERLVEGLYHRAGSDVIVANSPADARQFGELLEAVGFDSSSVVTEPLPFLLHKVKPAPAPTDGALTFAAQPDVPARKADREYVVQRLIEHAQHHPDQQVLLKVRGLAKERLTHPEPFPYQQLVDAVKEPLPPNFAVVSGPMNAALDRTGVLVTMSSTAAVEAIHRGIPTAILTDLGIREEMGNHYFAGSGCYASFDDLDRGVAPIAAQEWATDRGLIGLPPGALADRVRSLLGQELVAPRSFFTEQHSGRYLRALMANNGMDEQGRTAVFVSRRPWVTRLVRPVARRIYRFGYGVVAPTLRRLLGAR